MTKVIVDARPFVAVHDHTRPAVVLWRARKWVYVVAYDGGIRVVKVRADIFDREYTLLRPRVDGVEDSSREYDVQEAARKYLAWGSYAGITEVAAQALQTIIDRKGNVDMSNIETKTEAQGDVKVPTLESLGAAVAAAAEKAPKRASTKNGTTPEAKRASKAQTTKPTKEQAVNAKTEKPTAKGAKTEKPGKKAAAPLEPAKPGKKEAPATKKLTTKVEAPKAKTEGRGRPSSLDPALTIRVLVEKGVNPRREGGQGYANWPTIAKHDGKTVGKYLEAGGKADNLRTDVKRGHVKLVK